MCEPSFFFSDGETQDVECPNPTILEQTRLKSLEEDKVGHNKAIRAVGVTFELELGVARQIVASPLSRSWAQRDKGLLASPFKLKSGTAMHQGMLAPPLVGSWASFGNKPQGNNVTFKFSPGGNG